MSTQLITLRQANPVDAEFLYRVYANTRYEELAPANWPPEQVEAFLRMQFRAQDTYYHEHYADAAFDVIECDGVPVGRIYVDRRPDEIRIVDIALLPTARGAGVGTHLLTRLLAEATAANKPVRIHVEANNPAQRLYRRLGFVPTSTTGVYVLMERLPGARSCPG